MEQTRKPNLSISQQADLLLDDASARGRKYSLELFSSVEEEVLLSLQGRLVTIAEVDEVEKNHYLVASRLSRTNYDSLSKQEALMNALQKLRNGNRTNDKA